MTAREFAESGHQRGWENIHGQGTALGNRHRRDPCRISAEGAPGYGGDRPQGTGGKPDPSRGDPDDGDAPPALSGGGRGCRTAGGSGDREAGPGREGRLRRAGEPLPGRRRLRQRPGDRCRRTGTDHDGEGGVRLRPEEDHGRGDGGPPPGDPDEDHHRHPLPQIDALVGPGVPLCAADPLDPRPLRRPDRPLPDRKSRKRQLEPRPPLHEPRFLPGRPTGKNTWPRRATIS